MRLDWRLEKTVKRGVIFAEEVEFGGQLHLDYQYSLTPFYALQLCSFPWHTVASVKLDFWALYIIVYNQA